MNDEEKPKKKGFLRSAFWTAVGFVKELTIHSIIHFTLWGGLIAAGYAGFLMPVLDPVGEAVTGALEFLGIGPDFNAAASSSSGVASGPPVDGGLTLDSQSVPSTDPGEPVPEF